MPSKYAPAPYDENVEPGIVQPVVIANLDDFYKALSDKKFVSKSNSINDKLIEMEKSISDLNESVSKIGGETFSELGKGIENLKTKIDKVKNYSNNSFANTNKNLDELVEILNEREKARNSELDSLSSIENKCYDKITLIHQSKQIL